MEWGAFGDLAVSPPQLSGWRASPGMRSISGTASAPSETAGELEEGGRLLIRGPSLQAHRQIVASYRRLVLLFGLSVFEIQQWICLL